MSICDMPLPRPTASGKVDITGARIFLEDLEGHRTLVDLVQTYSKEQKVPWEPSRDVLYSFAIRVVLRSMSGMYKIWCKREWLSPSDLSFYKDCLTSFHHRALLYPDIPYHALPYPDLPSPDFHKHDDDDDDDQTPHS